MNAADVRNAKHAARALPHRLSRLHLRRRLARTIRAATPGCVDALAKQPPRVRRARDRRRRTRVELLQTDEIATSGSASSRSSTTAPAATASTSPLERRGDRWGRHPRRSLTPCPCLALAGRPRPPRPLPPAHWLLRALACLLVLGGLLLGLMLSAVIGALEQSGSARAHAHRAPRVADIPARYLQLYLAAGHRYGLDWAILAAIGSIETNHGRLRAPGVRSGANFAGAMGPMQFLGRRSAPTASTATRTAASTSTTPPTPSSRPPPACSATTAPRRTTTGDLRLQPRQLVARRTCSQGPPAIAAPSD